MRNVLINFDGWEVFEDSQVESIKAVCSNSVEFMVNHLLTDAIATIDLDGEQFYINIHDETMDNDLGRVNIDSIFNAYTDKNKLVTPDSLKRAVTMRDKLKDMMMAIDEAVKGAKSA
jgi:hypothetical protein